MSFGGGHLCPQGSKKGFQIPKVAKFRWFCLFEVGYLQNCFFDFDDVFFLQTLLRNYHKTVIPRKICNKWDYLF